jgi:hypothetical protein
VTGSKGEQKGFVGSYVVRQAQDVGRAGDGFAAPVRGFFS